MECPYCHHREMPGALFCRHCGYPLWEEEAQDAARKAGAAAPAEGARGASRGRGGRVRLRLQHGREVALQGPGPWLIGRPSGASRPDVDAQALGAQHVSRQHARLEWRRNGLFLIDLGSTNGTWVNGARLLPHEPQRLHSGDRVRWADLEVQIFLPTPGPSSHVAQEETSA